MPVQGDVRYEPITVSTTPIGMTLTPGVSGVRPQVAEVTVEDNAIRYRNDGGDPTATVGIGVEVGGVFILMNYGELKKFRAIRRDRKDATIQVNQGIEYIP